MQYETLIGKKAIHKNTGIEGTIIGVWIDERKNIDVRIQYLSETKSINEDWVSYESIEIVVD